MGTQGWIGVDLDGTLAEYHGWRGIEYIGNPVRPMVERIKLWLAEGKTVKVFTARVSKPGKDGEMAREFVENWCERHLGVRLEVTNIKDFGMVELWDDRAIQVRINEGHAVSGSRTDNYVAVRMDHDQPED